MSKFVVYRCVCLMPICPKLARELINSWLLAVWRRRLTISGRINVVRLRRLRLLLLLAVVTSVLSRRLGVLLLLLCLAWREELTLSSYRRLARCTKASWCV